MEGDVTTKDSDEIIVPAVQEPLEQSLLSIKSQNLEDGVYTFDADLVIESQIQKERIADLEKYVEELREGLGSL